MKKKVEYWETYTNLAYNVAGFVPMVLPHDQPFLHNLLFCVAMQVLGVGSFVYHHDKSANRDQDTIWKFDWAAMALANLIIAGLHFGEEAAWAMLLLGFTFYGYVILGKLDVYLEVSLTGVGALVGIWMTQSLTTFLIVILVFIIALFIRSLDRDTKQIEFHDSPYHSIWHLISALGLYLAAYLNV